jgi:hypothetical protein
MPGLNQKGPAGAGPKTGRGQGMCKRTEDLTLPGGGRGCGLGGRRAADGSRLQGKGQGRGQGQGGGMVQKATDGDVAESTELSELKNQYQRAADQLQQIEEKIKALES